MVQSILNFVGPAGRFSEGVLPGEGLCDPKNGKMPKELMAKPLWLQKLGREPCSAEEGGQLDPRGRRGFFPHVLQRLEEGMHLAELDPRRLLATPPVLEAS